MTAEDARALLYRLGPESYADRVGFARSRAGDAADDSGWTALQTLPARWQAPAFPIKAADLIDRGLVKGPALGAALRAAEADWIAAGFSSDPAILGGIANRAAAAHRT